MISSLQILPPRLSGWIKCIVAWLVLLVLLLGMARHGVMLWRLAPEGQAAVGWIIAVSMVVWFAPGICWLRWGGGRSRSLLDQVLLVATASMATHSLLVWSLYMAGHYSAGLAKLIVVAGLALALLALPWRKVTRLPRRITESVMTCPWVDLLAILLALGFCAEVGMNTTGQPLTSWDALVSWDKWSCDMAERDGFGAYLLGGYPQLLPSLCSLLYKISGTALASFPDEQLLMHNFAAPFAALLVLALIRLCRLWSASVATGLLLVMSLGPLHAWWRSGYVDIPATACIVAALALLTALARSELVLRPAAAISLVGVILFAVGFAKGYGLAWLILVPLLAAIQARKTAAFRRQGWKYLLAGFLLAVLLLAPFYLHQRWLSAHVGQVDSDPRLHTFAVSVNKSALYDRSPRAVMLRVRDMLDAFGQLPEGEREWISPPCRRILAAAGVVAGCGSLPGLVLAGSIGAQWWMWESTSAYDGRNLIPAWILLCVVIAMGAHRLAGSLGGAGRLVYGVAVLGVAGPWIMQEGRELSRVLDPAASRSLLKVWSQKPDQRLRSAAPHQFYMKVMLDQSPLGRRASRVYVPDELYRHLGRRGIYTLKGNVFTRVAPGDLLIRNASDPSSPGFVPLAGLDFPGYSSLSCMQPGLAPVPWTLSQAGEAASRTNPADVPLTTSGPVWLRCPQLVEMGSGDVLVLAVQFDTPEHARAISLQLPEAWDVLTHLRSRLVPIHDGCWIRMIIWLDRGEGFPVRTAFSRVIELQAPPSVPVLIRSVQAELIRNEPPVAP